MSPPPDRPVHAGPLPAPSPDAAPSPERAPDADDGGGLRGPSRPGGGGTSTPATGPAGRIGRTPPDVPYEVTTGTGTEDAFVLFAHDSVTLDGTDRATLSALLATAVGDARRPVTVTIHGYASGEGDATYNEHLSAHRAAAVQRWLAGRLPPGSEVRLLAHGETTGFGEEAAPNRRAGVDVEPRTTPPHGEGAEGTPGVEVASGPDEDAAPIDPDAPPPSPDASGANLLPLTPLGPSLLSPSLLSPPPATLPGLGSGWWRQPSRDPALDLFDSEVYLPLHLRGVDVDVDMIGSVEAHWRFWFWRLHRGLGMPEDWAAWVANTGTGVMLDTWAAQEHPTELDRMLREISIEHSMRGEWQTPIIPLHPKLRFDLTEILGGGR